MGKIEARSKKQEARSKKQEVRIETWQEAEALMRDYAQKQIAEAKLLAEMDEELNRVRGGFEAFLGPLQEQLFSAQDALEEFTNSRKAEFKAAPDGDGRSYEHSGIVIGFRKLLDKVALPRGEAKKEVALEYLMQYRPEFVRMTPEFNLLTLLDALKGDGRDVVKALDEHAGITLKPGKDEFFLKTKES